jgi:hypothetical protein
MILLYRGKSFISWRIKMCTLSAYSHAAWLKTNEYARAAIRTSANAAEIKSLVINLGCIEAWHVGGVRETAHLSDGHTKGTQIDVFDIPSVPDWKFGLIEDSLRREVGDGYWFGGILAARTNRYLLKTPPVDGRGDIKDWFCSHLVEHKLREYSAGLVNDRRPAHGVWPGMFETSKDTKYICTVTV